MNLRKHIIRAVATLIVLVAASLIGCRHAFECRGELSPTLPQWTEAPRAAPPPAGAED